MTAAHFDGNGIELAVEPFGENVLDINGKIRPTTITYTIMLEFWTSHYLVCLDENLSTMA